MKDANEAYQTQAQQYDPEISKLQQKALIKQLLVELRVCFNAQSKQWLSQLFKQYTNALQTVQEKPVSETGPILAEFLDTYLRQFADKYLRALK